MTIRVHGLNLRDRVWYKTPRYILNYINPKGVNINADLSLHNGAVILKRLILFCFPARARAQAFSWLSFVTGLQSKRDKSFVQTSSMNEGKIFHTGLVKKHKTESATAM